MIKSKIVGRVFQLDKHLGSDFRYESLRLECEADTYEEALKEVESDFKKYVAEKKKELKAKELNEDPFTGEQIIKSNKTIMKK